MNSPHLSKPLLSDDQKHKAIERINAIQNLLYLIRMDALNPALVSSHANQADRLLFEMQTVIGMP